jgi:hypothetical protein
MFLFVACPLMSVPLDPEDKGKKHDTTTPSDRGMVIRFYGSSVAPLFGYHVAARIRLTQRSKAWQLVTRDSIIIPSGPGFITRTLAIAMTNPKYMSIGARFRGRWHEDARQNPREMCSYLQGRGPWREDRHASRPQTREHAAALARVHTSRPDGDGDDQVSPIARDEAHHLSTVAGGMAATRQWVAAVKASADVASRRWSRWPHPCAASSGV